MFLSSQSTPTYALKNKAKHSYQTSKRKLLSQLGKIINQELSADIILNEKLHIPLKN